MSLHRFIEFFHEFRQPTGFEMYLMNLQRHSHSAAPSVDEARRDYRAILRLEVTYPL